MVTKSSTANAERVKRKLGAPLTKSVRDNITCCVVQSTAMELAARTIRTTARIVQGSRRFS